MADKVGMAKELLRAAMRPSRTGKKASGRATPQDSDPFPSEWQVHTAKNGRKFWYNRRTKKSQWNDPNAKDAIWTSHTAKSGKTFYYNKMTKKSTWTKPLNFPYDDKDDDNGSSPTKIRDSDVRTASSALLAAAASKASSASASGRLSQTSEKATSNRKFDIASLAKLKLRARRAKKCVIKRRLVLSKSKTRDGEYTITKNDDVGNCPERLRQHKGESDYLTTCFT